MSTGPNLPGVGEDPLAGGEFVCGSHVSRRVSVTRAFARDIVVSVAARAHGWVKPTVLPSERIIGYTVGHDGFRCGQSSGLLAAWSSSGLASST